NVSGWTYWELIDYCNGDTSGFCGGGPYNNGLTYPVSNSNGNPPSTLVAGKRFYTVGQWSKFIRSGWQRIDTTTNPQTGVYVTAFKNPAGTAYTVVAVNTNTTAGGTSQTFPLSGFPTTTSVTPYVTSSSLNLAQQSSVAVSSNAFTYTLTASSVTSFVGNTAPAEGLAPP